MKSKTSTRNRLLRIFGAVLLAALLLLYLGLPAGMAVFAVLPARQAAPPAPEGFETVSLPTQDGVELKAWYYPPENGAAILLLPGAGSARASLRPYASLLAQHGFGVLAVDLRGQGESGGQTNRFGWQGTQDVAAALDFLEAQEEVSTIGGLGISMGGEVLLGAASQFPALRAIAADGATRRCTQELLALEAERPLVRNFTARVMFATVQLLTGDAPPKPLLESMVEAPATRYLLIAGGGNAQETAFNRLFAATLGDRASLWVAPEAAHTAALGLYPQEYEQRVVAFFEEHLGK